MVLWNVDFQPRNLFATRMGARLDKAAQQSLEIFRFHFTPPKSCSTNSGGA